MYLSHYKLQQMPFQISPDPKFLWLGEKHREALAILKYGVINNQGFLLLTGDVGTGKTTLINALMNTLDPDTVFIHIPDPRLDKLDFFKLVAHSLGMDVKLTTKFDFFVLFRDFLHGAYRSNKKVLLIIDEAQKLSLDSLEEIRLLSNIEKQESKLLNIFFIGQDEFNDILIQPECRALRQRITIVHHIEPLDEKETVEYVKYRLRVAGTQRGIFTGKAMKGIYAFSKGHPRLINILCDRALLNGYSNDLDTIDHKVIREASCDLSLPGEKKDQRTLRALAGQIGASLRDTRRAAILACLVIILILSGYLIGSRFIGDYRFRTGGPINDVSQSPGQDRPDSPAGKIDPQGAERSSSPAPAASHASPKDVSQPDPESTGAKNSEPADTSVLDSLFRKSKMIIPFGYDSNDLSPEVLARIDELAKYLLRKPEAAIVIRGFTDDIGGSDYNKSLSAFRANVVKSYLTGKGIAAHQMTAVGMGQTGARMSNATPEGRSANRRVEIELVVRQP